MTDENLERKVKAGRRAYPLKYLYRLAISMRAGAPNAAFCPRINKKSPFFTYAARRETEPELRKFIEGK